MSQLILCLCILDNEILSYKSNDWQNWSHINIKGEVGYRHQSNIDNFNMVLGECNLSLNLDDELKAVHFCVVYKQQYAHFALALIKNAKEKYKNELFSCYPLEQVYKCYSTFNVGQNVLELDNLTYEWIASHLLPVLSFDSSYRVHGGVAEPVQEVTKSSIEPKAFFHGVDNMTKFEEYERFDLTRFFPTYLPVDPEKRLEAMKKLEAERIKQCKQVIESFVANTHVNEETQEEVVGKLDIESSMFDLIPAVNDLALSPSSVFAMLKDNINHVEEKSFLLTVEHKGIITNSYPIPPLMPNVSSVLSMLRIARNIDPTNENILLLHNHITRLINLHLIRNHGNVTIDSIGGDNAELIDAFGNFDVTFLTKFIQYDVVDNSVNATVKVTYNFLPINVDSLDVMVIVDDNVGNVVKLDEDSFFTNNPEIYDGVLNVTLDGVMFYTVVDNKGETWLYRLDGMLAK